MNNILVSGYQDGSDNVMVFSKHINADLLRQYFDGIGHSYSDIVDVKDADCQFYVYDPLWMDFDQEKHVLHSVTRSLLNQASTKGGKIEFNIESPDGFTVHWENFHCLAKELFAEVDYQFNLWKKRYERQGYYSANEMRIPLSQLKEHCKFILIAPDPSVLKLPIHKNPLSLL